MYSAMHQKCNKIEQLPYLYSKAAYFYLIPTDTNAIHAPHQALFGPSREVKARMVERLVKRPNPYSTMIIGMDQRKRNKTQTIRNWRQPVSC